MFNVGAVIGEIEEEIKKACKTGLREGMEEVKTGAIALSEARIYSLPETWYKRTGNYKGAFSIEPISEYCVALSNDMPYAIYVEYKHSRLILTDAVVSQGKYLIIDRILNNL